MTKAFNEVFRGIKLQESIKPFFRDAVVERILSNSEKQEVYIHITLSEVVHPVQLEKAEYKLKTFLDLEDSGKVFIRERYELKDQLPFQSLYAFYKSALGYLIRREYPLCGVHILKVEPEIEGSNVRYELTDQLYEYFTDKKIARVIEEIYKAKFNLEITVEMDKISGKDVYEQLIESKVKEQEQLLRRIHQEELVKVNNAKGQINKTQKTIEKVSGTEKESDQKKKKVQSKRPENLIIGRRPIYGEVQYIDEFDESTRYVIIEGQIVTSDAKQIRGKKIVVMDVHDFTYTISCKAFVDDEDYDRYVKPAKLKSGKFVRIKGELKYDTFIGENSITISELELIKDFRKKKQDLAETKRVELHAHTQMSDMDAVVSAHDLVFRAFEYGHKAIAITDHGVCQAFPDAFHAAQAINKDEEKIKVIYGVEGYLVDDERPTFKGIPDDDFNQTLVVFDIETTGLIPGRDTLTEIGAVKIKNRKIIDRFSTFVNPERGIPLNIQKLTGISMDMVKDAPLFQDALKDFLAFADGCVMVAHNADFDMGFIRHFAEKANYMVNHVSLDTLEMARCLYTEIGNHRLNTLAKHLGVNLGQHHRAVYDAEATAEILLKMMEDMNDQNIHTFSQYINYEKTNNKNVGRMRPTHVVIMAQNQIGLRNLYELVSDSHIKYFSNLRPRIPKSVLRKMREGLLIGSACESGELYQAVLEGKSDEEIDRIAKFYDYYEVQPLGNNDFLVRENKVDSKRDLEEINKRIVDLGKAHKKPVVATGDVHFMDPSDEVYRRILMGAKGYKDADNQPPVYFRTTEEMLAEFYYLDSETAYDVVVTNPNIVADMVEYLEPVPPDKYPPVIEGSDQELRDICYEKAHEIYGEELPEIVVSRLERELKSIIGNGFSVMYIIAQKLVWKSNEDGYLVGSRGSVGSSFAATMSGITEVNPLPAHYICPKCHYVDFDSETVKAHSGNSGCDLPDQTCPSCGHELIKEGHDIPFETFLGFYGDKEPDIDLNFSGDYQSKAHDYTEVLFGEGHVFRAGTIGTLADKTAYGYLTKYLEERDLDMTKAQKNFLVQGCVGVRRTTGQHPGGIIVVPKDQSIYNFTPVQRPANDMKSTTTTTHFDYHSIDHNLLKLDILGHDDPSMIRMLEDLTGIDATKIPLDEPQVMSLFNGLEALKISAEDIDGTRLGSLGIPEFGTDFVIQMLEDTKPSCFSDLVRISGLSHGTDVWLNNAQELIRDGKADITGIISTRDDIMTYLIHMGMEKGLAFKIMEAVRKGKGLTPEWEEAMIANNVPDWYIWSCKQIKYMFPKAHAVAYVMMAYRIAYFKVYHPLAYYTAFFTIRASNFDYEIMCHGKNQLDQYIKEYKAKQTANQITAKEKDMIKDMRIVQEMYARGFDFEPIDLYRVDAKNHQIFDGKIMPALSSIQGLGEKAAESIVESRKDGKFLSIEDLIKRAKISKTVAEVMKENHILQGMQETNQVDLFSMFDDMS